MKKMTLFIFLLVLNFPAVANSHRYQVEVILFQHLNPTDITQENWPNYPALPETENAIEYPLISSSAWLLQNEAARIRNSNQYHLLGHLAWQQPILISAKATRVHLQSQSASDTEWNLDGTLSLSRSNYLIVNANLMLTLPRTSGDVTNSDQSYRQVILKQKHRMRARELYYFDQPLFGMLIKIVPVG